MKKKYLRMILLMAAFVMSPICFSEYAEAAPAVKVESSPISAGVEQEIYYWDTSYGPIRIAVLKCDLTNPGFDLRVIPGAGEYTRRATVTAMAEQTDAVAVTNGDFFNTLLEGAPIGPSVINGELESSPAKLVGVYSLGIDGDRKAHIEPILYNGKVTAANGNSYPIDGLNKTYYWHDITFQESHTDTIQLYNDFWGSPSRGHATNSELLVNGEGVVERIEFGKTLPYEVPDGKYILQVNGSAESFIRDNVKVGDVLKIDSAISPERNWDFLIGGHALVTDNYQMLPYTKDLNALAGIRARTFAGISDDGNILWLASAEGRTNRSVGITLPSMGYFMQQLGAYRAVNLDGGGSTALVAKSLGSFEHDVVTYPENYYGQRAVVNGIGVFNVAPKGMVSGFEIDGPDSLVVGETGAFYVTKAWDENYHPHVPNENAYVGEENPYGFWSGGYFLPLVPGETSLRMHIPDRGVASEKYLQIKGAEAISSLRLSGDNQAIGDGSYVYASLEADLLDGRTILISPQAATWTLNGVTGSMDNKQGLAYLIAMDGVPIGKLSASIGDKQADLLLYNTAYHSLLLEIGQQAYYDNGNRYEMDVAPLIMDDRTMVPLRFIGEAFGGQVDWNGSTGEVMMLFKGKEIKMMPDSEKVLVDGKQVSLDRSASLVNDRTMVPLRFISELLGMKVDYIYESQQVFITELS